MEKVQYLGTDGTHDFSIIIREDSNFTCSTSCNTTYETRTETKVCTTPSTNTCSGPNTVYNTTTYKIPHNDYGTTLHIENEVFNLSQTYKFGDDTLARRIILKVDDKEILLKALLLNPNIQLREVTNLETYFRSNFGGGFLISKSSVMVPTGKNANGNDTFTVITAQKTTSEVFVTILLVSIIFLCFIGPFAVPYFFSIVALLFKRIQPLSTFCKNFITTYSFKQYFKFVAIPILILIISLIIVKKKTPKKRNATKEERDEYSSKFNTTYGPMLYQAKEIYTKYSQF